LWRVSVQCGILGTLLVALSKRRANTPAQDRTQLGIAKFLNGAMVIDRRVECLPPSARGPPLRLFTFSFPSEHSEHLFAERVPTTERTEQNTLECSVSSFCGCSVCPVRLTKDGLRRQFHESRSAPFRELPLKPA